MAIEIVTGWKSSIDVVTKVMNMQVFVESDVQNKRKV